MVKWIFLVMIAAGITLYLGGALEVGTSDEVIDVSLDKQKAKALGESIQESLRE